MDIRERLRQHIAYIFQDAPQTRAILELKEELLANSIERFTDLTLQGKSPEDAYQQVASSIGNVDELIAAAQSEAGGFAGVQANQKKRAMITSAAVGLYILAGIVFLTGAFLEDISEYAFWGCFIGALFIAIIPTVMLVYQAVAHPAYNKANDTVIENFKEWNNETSRNTALRKSIQSTVWTLIVVIYLAISFITGAWGITWLIFLIGTVINNLIDLAFKMRETK